MKIYTFLLKLAITEHIATALLFSFLDNPKTGTFLWQQHAINLMINCGMTFHPRQRFILRLLHCCVTFKKNSLDIVLGITIWKYTTFKKDDIIWHFSEEKNRESVKYCFSCCCYWPGFSSDYPLYQIAFTFSSICPCDLICFLVSARLSQELLWYYWCHDSVSVYDPKNVTFSSPASLNNHLKRS